MYELVFLEVLVVNELHGQEQWSGSGGASHR